jgi:hypothetical protein
MQNNLADLEHVIHLNKWIEQIIEPLPDLEGYATCPFAKQAQKNQILIEKINLVDIIPPTDINFEIIIYVVEDNINPDQLDQSAAELNLKYNDLVFLPDHPGHTLDAGVKAYSSNGRYNLILCQPKIKLRKARETLTKTKYYSLWNADYLKKIMGDDYGLLD